MHQGINLGSAIQIIPRSYPNNKSPTDSESAGRLLVVLYITLRMPLVV